jgi:hypothetical protein
MVMDGQEKKLIFLMFRLFRSIPPLWCPFTAPFAPLVPICDIADSYCNSRLICINLLLVKKYEAIYRGL